MKFFNKLLSLFAFIGYFGCSKGEDAYVTFDPEMEQRPSCTLPPSFKIEIETGSSSMTLQLTRNDHVHPEAPAYVIQAYGGNDYIFKAEEAGDGKHQAAYQESQHEVALLVTCHQHEQAGAKYEMEGTLFLEDLKYRILPSRSRLSSYQRLFHSENVKLYHLFRSKEDLPFDAGIDVSLHEEILAKTYEDVRLPNRRVKRETTEATDIYLDVLVLLEYSVMEVWKTRAGGASEGRTKAKEYFTHVMNAVNLRFSHIDTQDYKFIVRLVGFFISETNETSPWTEDHVTLFDGVMRINATLTLNNLRELELSNKTGAIAHDHLMLFTSYDIIGGDTGYRFNYTTGLTNVKSMCNKDGFSVSVVEDHGGFQSVGTATHELGHSLGAYHDGQYDDCVPSDRFIMAPQSYDETNETKYNPWFFSNCSIQAFVDFVENSTDTDRESCLTGSEPVNENVPDIGDQMPGQLYPPDEQCRQQFGDESYLCRGTNFDSGDLFCRAMFCASSNASVCLLVTAAPGTTCGNKTWCMDGKCQKNDGAPVASDSCPHGDSPIVTTSNGTSTCDTLLSRPENCYLPEWTARCCNTCAQICDGPEECPCGDKTNAGNCEEDRCSEYSSEDKLKCCHTCRNYTTTTGSTTSMMTSLSPSTTTTATEATKTSSTSTTTAEVTYPSTCTDVIPFESTTCEKYMLDFGSKACYKDKVNKSCCSTCLQNARTEFPNCPWGDMSPPSCHPLKTYIGEAICPKDETIEKFCCGTCAELIVAINVKLETQGSKNDTTSSVSRVHLEFSLFIILVLPLFVFPSLIKLVDMH